MNNKHLFPFKWRIADGYPAKGIKKNECLVFGTFICGGGSSMGYKLAGFNHIGGIELDPNIADIYKTNHNPEYLFNMDIREFNKLQNLPDVLFNLDILDGSPPCSTFSMSGDRENAWGKNKKFAEGQKKQTLDDLVFVYCDTIEKLKPKVCLLENVSGLIKGNAKVYAKEIHKRISSIGYNVQVFLLNSETMGVPQKRERCFFIGLRNDFKLPKLKLDFQEKPIMFKEIKDNTGGPIQGEKTLRAWNNKLPIETSIGDTNLRLTGKRSSFNTKYQKDNKVCYTITASTRNVHFNEPLYISETEILKASTFPLDYQANNIPFLCGMSVPPVMMAQIANQIYKQWLSKI